MNKILAVLLIIVFGIYHFLQNSEYHGIIGSILGSIIGYSSVYLWRFNDLKECLLQEAIFTEEENKKLLESIDVYLKSKTYDINIPDGEDCREK